MSNEVRLEVQDVSKTFGITKAVQHVSEKFYKGEIHALIGENGSGKSTLTNMLTGIYTKDSGKFILDGVEVNAKNQVDANNHGIAIIVQELLMPKPWSNLVMPSTATISAEVAGRANQTARLPTCPFSLKRRIWKPWSPD